MYDRIHDQSAMQALRAWMDQCNFRPGGPDGLEVIPPSGAAEIVFPDIPQRLHDWFVNVRLLRHIPLPYIVPDAALLPSESIRFFHVNPTWIDCVIDGMLSAADIGTVDLTFTAMMLQIIRRDLDDALTAIVKTQVPASNWTPNNPMTGFLMRSEAVRRWPDMVISAFDNADGSQAKEDAQRPIAVLRHECISDTIYIALFAGEPKRVEIREPHVALRFGVEVIKGTPKKYQVRARGENGGDLNSDLPLAPFRPGSVLNVFQLAKDISAKDKNLAQLANKPTQAIKDPAPPHRVALDLERPPFIQDFSNLNTADENSGWEPTRLVSLHPIGHLGPLPVNEQPIKP
jgi:hypothetical protein